MSNQSNTETPGDDEAFGVTGQNPIGFALLYHDTTRRLLKQHSAILRTYLCLGAFANSRRDAYPSRSKIAKLIDMDPRSVQRAISTLESIGLLSVRRFPGSTSFYHLLAPDEDGYGVHQGGDTHVSTGETPMSRGVETPMSPKQEPIYQQPNNNLSSSRARDEDGVPVDFDEEEKLDEVQENAPMPNGQPSGKQAQSSSEQKGRSVQSNGNIRLDAEMRNPYWQGEAGEERRRSLSAVYQKYPKPGDRLPVAVAYREVIGEYADSSRSDGIAFYEHVWNRLHDWMEHWQKERTEDQWIPYLANWIRKEKFNEVPGVRRK